MKLIFKTVLLLIFLQLIICIKDIIAQEGILFRGNTDSWQAVIEQAQEEGKPIFVDVHTDWCGPCKWMEQTVV